MKTAIRSLQVGHVAPGSDDVFCKVNLGGGPSRGIRLYVFFPDPNLSTHLIRVTYAPERLFAPCHARVKAPQYDLCHVKVISDLCTVVQVLHMVCIGNDGGEFGEVVEDQALVPLAKMLTSFSHLTELHWQHHPRKEKPCVYAEALREALRKLLCLQTLTIDTGV